ncbi:Rid family hydrolase [Paraburkholderia sediminicola]|uniref:Rid family hydrolase n=1 Tax=Paraburkholderia sediminicola TaxID=458836 RepID=UPI0038BDA31B
MSQITRFDTTEKLSKAVASGQFVFISGQVPDNAEADPYQQTLEAMTKVEKYLLKAGCTRSDMLFAMIFVKNLTNLAEINRAWGEWLPEGCAPARACVEATPASSQFEVQIFAVGQRASIA